MTKRAAEKLNSRRGYSMAEVLIMVAILMVLSGFGFVSLISFQNKMNLKEADDTAKAIFMAAQNNLTEAWATGELEENSLDHPVDTDEDLFFGYSLGGTKYLACSYDGHRGVNLHEINDVVGDLLLPFGSIDETVRTGFSYAIVYDRRKAEVRQVFCCRNNRDLSEDDLVLKLIAFPDYLQDEKRDNDWRIKQAKEAGNDGESVFLGYYGVTE